MTTYNILLSFNNNYTQHACVLLASVFENNKCHSFHIHVIHRGLSEKNCKIINDFCTAYNAKVSFYYIDIKDYYFPNLESHYISVDTYLRLFIADYLDNSIDRILYLDVDMIVNGDLSELLNTDIGNVVLAAIEDAPVAERFVRLRLDSKLGYFNAGMLYINMVKWRKLDITKKSLEYLKKYPERILYHDQDVLNAIIKGQWKRIEFKWNMLDAFFWLPPLIQEKYTDELSACKQDVRIIHYTGGVKPWHAWTKNPYYHKYYEYLKFTPWKGYKPSLSSQWRAYKFPRNVLTILHIDRLIWLLIKKHLTWIAVYKNEKRFQKL